MKKKPNTVRPGQKKPFSKATQAEIQSRIEAIARMITDRKLSKSEIHRVCLTQYNVGWRQVDRYVTSAREFILAAANRPKEDFRSDALMFYEGIIRNPNSTIADRSGAQKEINCIIGLYPPRAIRVGDPDGKPLQAAVVAPVVNFIIPDNGRNGGNGKPHE